MPSSREIRERIVIREALSTVNLVRPITWAEYLIRLESALVRSSVRWL